MNLTKIVNDLNLNTKILLIGIISLVAVLVPAYLVISGSNAQMRGTESEILGSGANDALIKSLKLLQIHRGLSSGAINGNQQQADQLGDVAKNITEKLGELEEKVELIQSDVLTKHVGDLIGQWKLLESKVEQRSIDAAVSFAEHTKLINSLLTTFWELGKESGLWYDPEVTSYHLIIASMEALPKATESLAKIRGLGNSVLTQKQITEQQAEAILQAKGQLMVYSEVLNTHLATAISSDASLSKLSEINKRQFDQINSLIQLVETEILHKKNFTLEPKEYWISMSTVIDELYLLNDGAFEHLQRLLNSRIDRLTLVRNEILVVLGVLFAVFVVFGWIFVRSLKNSIDSIQTVTSEIASGNYTVVLDTKRKDEFGKLNQSMLNLNQQLQAAASVANENARIRNALDVTTSNVMLADANRTIVYLNKSVEKMLKNAEADLRKALPNFSVDKVLGSNMDIFHRNPSHQSQLLENLRSTYVSNILVAGRSFRLFANPIFNKDGVRLGSVVEWVDRTSEVAAESEVSTLVEAAATGNFGSRISIDGKDGFYLKIAQGLNQLVETSEKGLNDVARVLGAMAKGDLTAKIDADYSGTFGDLKNYCNDTNDNLTSMLLDIRNAAETIFTASSEIAQGNADLSSRTEQQAANLEETASSMEELTSTVKLNADNAKQANVLAEQASSVATDGGALIQKVVVTMDDINQSAKKISDIIGVIDGIAFQTNILALNAAVEAARAGDQGRGFAVVASEVRTLAQRSANAAKDIKALISDSVQKIESGNSLVNKSGETMKEIVNSIKRVNDIMSEIAAASNEQSTGIEEVSTAVSQMDEMTQQNAALVEEAAAAAESLQSQADQLNRSVGQFRLSVESTTVAAPRLAAPRVSQSGAATPSAPKKSPPQKLAPPKSNADDEWESF